MNPFTRIRAAFGRSRRVRPVTDSTEPASAAYEVPEPGTPAWDRAIHAFDVRDAARNAATMREVDAEEARWNQAVREAEQSLTVERAREHFRRFERIRVQVAECGHDDILECVSCVDLLDEYDGDEPEQLNQAARRVMVREDPAAVAAAEAVYADALARQHIKWERGVEDTARAMTRDEARDTIERHGYSSGPCHVLPSARELEAARRVLADDEPTADVHAPTEVDRGHGARDCDPGLVGPAGAQGDYRPDWVIWAEQDDDECNGDRQKWEGDVENFARNMSPDQARVILAEARALREHVRSCHQDVARCETCSAEERVGFAEADRSAVEQEAARQTLARESRTEPDHGTSATDAGMGDERVETALEPAPVKPAELMDADEVADEGGFVEEETHLSSERRTEGECERWVARVGQRPIDGFSERLEEPDEDTDDSHEGIESGPRAGVDDHGPSMGFGFVAPSRAAGGVGCTEGSVRAARSAMGHLHEQSAVAQHRITGRARAGQVSLWRNDTQADDTDRHESAGWDVTD